MSRLCVKNIGKNTNEKQLRDLFSEKGEVTDVKVVKSDKGFSRKFAFVGFRTDLQAEEAQKYFNNTFIGQSRIAVEFAKKINDSELQELKEKHAKKNNHAARAKRAAEAHAAAAAAGSGVGVAAAKKPMSQNMTEFMEVMKSRKNTKSWANDDSASASKPGGDMNDPMAAITAAAATSSNATRGTTFPGDDSDDSGESADEIGAVWKEKNKGGKKNKKNKKSTAVATWGDSDEDDSDDLDSVNSDDDGETDKPQPKNDLDYLKSKRSANFSESDDDENDNDDNDDDDDNDQGNGDEDSDEDSTIAMRRQNRKADNSVVAGRNESEIVKDDEHEKMGNADVDDEDDSSRLFVKNLPYTCTEDELTQVFEGFGKISEVHIPLDADRKSKGIGFVSFLFPEHAKLALRDVDGSSFQGRLLRIEFAKKAPETAPQFNSANSKLSSFQQKKEEERRKAANNQQGWNSSFVRSDAVVASLSDKYGVSQSDILDSTQHGGELAVRLAIGESQVIMDNKTFFASHGVDLSALESSSSGSRAAKRSTTTILVKNLPPNTVQDEVESLFARFGVISSFLIPKSNSLALVDFVEPSEARQAYKHLAYRAYKHQPLYLEWAPLGIINTDLAAIAKNKSSSGSGGVESATEMLVDSSSSSSAAAAGIKSSKTSVNDTTNDDDDYFTLFIKNLNFVTTDDALRDHLIHLGVRDLRAVSIQKKTVASRASSGGNGTAMISQGYGFAEFSVSASAKQAQVLINGSLLDSHSLEAKPSTKRLSGNSGSIAVSSSALPAGGTSKTAATKKRSSDSMSSSAAGGAASSDDRRTKLIVRNVAFQATRKELLALFSSFGSVKRVRIPKKMGGEHRGFAFVEFATSQEASAAMNSLTSTHLYGRHLVLEWAKEEDEDGGEGEKVAEQRKRSKADEKAIQLDKRAHGTVNMGGSGNTGGDDEGGGGGGFGSSSFNFEKEERAGRR